MLYLVYLLLVLNPCYRSPHICCTFIVKIILLILQVLVPQIPEIFGKMVQVKIVSTQKHCMIAELLEEVDQTRDSLSGSVQTNPLRLRANINLNGKHTDKLATTIDSTGRDTRRFKSFLLPLLLLGITIFVRLLWAFWLPKKSLKRDASALL